MFTRSASVRVPATLENTVKSRTEQGFKQTNTRPKAYCVLAAKIPDGAMHAQNFSQHSTGGGKFGARTTMHSAAGVPPKRHAFNAVLTAAAKGGNLSLCRDVYRRMLAAEVHPHLNPNMLYIYD